MQLIKVKLLTSCMVNFLHAPVDRLINITEAAGFVNDSELIDQIKPKLCRTIEIFCREYRLSKPKPSDKTSLAFSFNEFVVINLRLSENYFFYI